MAAKRTAKRKTAAGARAAESYPTMRAFLAGYLHQDFALDYGTPEDALQAYLRDASRTERRALRREWRALTSAQPARRWADTRKVFDSLGGAWQPVSQSELIRVFGRLADEVD